MRNKCSFVHDMTGKKHTSTNTSTGNEASHSSSIAFCVYRAKALARPYLQMYNGIESYGTRYCSVGLFFCFCCFEEGLSEVISYVGDSNTQHYSFIANTPQSRGGKTRPLMSSLVSL
jgi:hypothetical protein